MAKYANPLTESRIGMADGIMADLKGLERAVWDNLRCDYTREARLHKVRAKDAYVPVEVTDALAAIRTARRDLAKYASRARRGTIQ